MSGVTRSDRVRNENKRYRLVVGGNVASKVNKPEVMKLNTLSSLCGVSRTDKRKHGLSVGVGGKVSSIV